MILHINYMFTNSLAYGTGTSGNSYMREYHQMSVQILWIQKLISSLDYSLWPINIYSISNISVLITNMNEIILQIIKPLDSNQTLNLSLRHNLHSKVSQTDPAAFKARQLLGSRNCELPWNYRLSANAPKVLLHSANLSTDTETARNSKDRPFVLFQITLTSHTGFGFFIQLSLFSHPHVTLPAIWGPLDTTKTQVMSLASLLHSSCSTVNPVLSAQRQNTCGCSPPKDHALHPLKGQLYNR